MAETSTATRGARAAFITVAGQATKVILQVLSVVVLSRLLSPDAFGLVAMVTVFVNLGGTLRDFGLSSAALQSSTLTKQQASNLFWANTVLSVALTVILAACTPLLVSFYHEPRLGAVVPALAVVVALGGLQTQLQVHLSRELRFLALASTDVGSQLLGFAVAVVGAVVGLSYWALVLQALTTAFSLLVSRALAAGWRPLRPRRDGATGPLITAGAHIGSAQLLSFAASNTDTVSIGARFGADALAHYSRAFSLLMAPIQAVISPLMNVVLPIAHRARAEGKSYDEVLLRVQFLAGVGSVWLFMVAAASAPILLPLVLGPAWGPSVTIFEVFAIGGAVRTFETMNFWSFLLHRQERQVLPYDLVTKLLTVAVILACVAVSPLAVAWGYSAVLVISWPISLVWLRIKARLDAWAYARGGLRVLMAGALGYMSGRLLIAMIGTVPPILEIAVAIVASTVVYAVGLAAVPGGMAKLREALRLGKSLLGRPRAV